MEEVSARKKAAEARADALSVDDRRMLAFLQNGAQSSAAAKSEDNEENEEIATANRIEARKKRRAKKEIAGDVKTSAQYKDNATKGQLVKEISATGADLGKEKARGRKHKGDSQEEEGFVCKTCGMCFNNAKKIAEHWKKFPEHDPATIEAAAKMEQEDKTGEEKKTKVVQKRHGHRGF